MKILEIYIKIHYNVVSTIINNNYILEETYMAENKQKRAMLNTTINDEVLDSFRDYCKGINCPMNMVLETFMKQFAEGQFSFKLSKSKMELDIDN